MSELDSRAEGLKVMLLDSDEERAELLREHLAHAGHRVVAHVSLHTSSLVAAVETFRPDVIVIRTDSPDRDTLEHLAVMAEHQPRPVVMFADDRDAQSIRAATRAGVSAYVVDGLEPARLQPILEAAVARFEQLQAVREELVRMRDRLSERTVVEKAKGLVMQRKGITEEQAYRLLRKLAMDRNVKLVQVAEEVVRSAELL